MIPLILPRINKAEIKNTKEDNRILVVNEYNQVSIFDQSTLTWSSVSNSTKNHGWTSSLTLLNDGRVLCTGGESDGVSAEIYDPMNDTWTGLPDMSVNRSGHTSILLNNGKVLIFGADNLSSVCEIFDPTSNTFSITGSLNMFRTDSPAVLISNGQVLTYGRGSAVDFFDTKSIEIYDPTVGTWSAPTNSIQGSVGVQLEVLNDNRIMVIGGIAATNSADIRCFFLGPNYTALGVSKINNKKNISIYPNPVNNTLNINLDKLNSDNIKIQIIDLTGKVVFTSSVYSNANNLISLDINGLKNGIYFCKVYSTENVILKEKIIINK